MVGSFSPPFSRPNVISSFRKLHKASTKVVAPSGTNRKPWRTPPTAYLARSSPSRNTAQTSKVLGSSTARSAM